MAAGNGGVRFENSVGSVVEENGAVVGEDEEVSVDVEVEERVEVVFVLVGGSEEEREGEGGGGGEGILRIELVVELLAAADDYGASVGEDLVSGVPA